MPVRLRRPLSTRELASIRMWQRTDRAYALVQGALRGAVHPEALSARERRDVELLIDDLMAAIEAGRTREALTVYRGIRSVWRTFGIADPFALSPEIRSLTGFTATSVYRSVAVSEFVTSGGALLEIAVPAGTPALWVADAGDPRLRYQGELLFADRLRLEINRVRRREGLVVISAEVIA